MGAVGLSHGAELYGSAVGQSYRAEWGLWGSAVGLSCGAVLWGTAIGQSGRCSAELWGRAVGQSSMVVLWGRAIGQSGSSWAEQWGRAVGQSRIYGAKQGQSRGAELSAVGQSRGAELSAVGQLGIYGADLWGRAAPWGPPLPPPRRCSTWADWFIMRRS